MTIRQIGGEEATRGGRRTRALQFDLRTRAGDANIKSVSVTLSNAFEIDQRHLGNICSENAARSESVRGRQPIGNVWVETPLLDQPLQGPVYAVSGFGGLPRLAFILDGQVTMLPQAESKSVNNGHLKTVVPIVPDVPIGHFRLTSLGGKKGYLINTKDLCRKGGRIGVAFAGQNGKELTKRLKVNGACGGKG